MALLSLEDITVRFGGLTAVDGLSLDVHAGEVVGLIGPNGAGKTVTFNVATGLQRPASGRVHLAGEEVTDWPTHARARHGIGRTFQVVQLVEDLSVLDNVALAGHRFTYAGMLADALRLPARRQALEEARERAWGVCQLLGITSLLDRPVATLPIGQARLVELARALALQPRLLLLDEPASGLDSTETDELLDLLRRILDVTGCGVLLVEHDMDVIGSLCDHVAVMDLGRLIASGSPDEVRADPQVRTSYLGAEHGDGAVDGEEVA